MTEESRIALVATTCRESGEVRARLALQGARKARLMGFSVCVVDADSDPKFLEKLAELDVSVRPQQGTTLGSARREAIQMGFDTGAEVIAYTELEKVSLIPGIPALARRIFEDKADIIIPARRSMESYPEFQQQSERQGNQLWERITGQALDVFFGPRVFRRSCAQYFLNYQGEFGDRWESIFVPLLSALHDKWRMKGIDVDFVYPAEQAAEEQASPAIWSKRQKQLKLISQALIQASASERFVSVENF